MLEPITNDNPCGDDIKYDDEYLKIETEIEKNFNSANTDETDWNFVISGCEKLLLNKTKDLRLLSYWLYAQKKLNDWGVFFKSLDTYVAVLKRYHIELHPKSEKRKIKIFEWLETTLEDEFLKSLEKFSKNELNILLNIFETLEEDVSKMTSAKYKLFKEVQSNSVKYIEKIQRKEDEAQRINEAKNKQALKEKEEKETISKAQQLRRSAEKEILDKFSSSNTMRITDKEEQLKNSDFEEIVKFTIDVSTKFLEKAPKDYFSYRLLFSIGSMLIEESLNNNATKVDNFVPSLDIINAARALIDEKASLGQLNALIEQLLIRPTWLEGYYIVSKILFQLSKKEDGLKLENMLFYFLYKEKNILNIVINNEPFITKEMILWMQTKALSLNDSGEKSLEYQSTYQEVLRIKDEQNKENALTLLENKYQKSKGEEARFRWRLLFVDFAIEIGDKKAAVSLLLELEKIIEIYKIDFWQPELAIATYETLLKPMLMQELKTESKERIYNKLSILDIKKVINLH